MSFGDSPSDIIIVVDFARRLYRQCKNAGGEYHEISREVRGLHTVLKHLKYEVEAPESVLNRDRSVYAKELAPVIGDCDVTLRQLDELLQKYDRLGREGGASRLWDKLRFGSLEMDELGSIRMKLINHKTTITVFLDNIQLHESSRMSAALDNQGGQLDIILDKVDTIAARMGQRAGSSMTTYDDDDEEVWKQFRRELVLEGFSNEVLQQHKDVLRAYIRQIDQNGLLDELPSDSQTALPAGGNPERWLDSMTPPSTQSPQPEQGPPSFESLNTKSEDRSAKERVMAEDNMKYLRSMRVERPKPECKPAGDDIKQMAVSGDDRAVLQKEGIGDPVPSLPRPIIAADNYRPTKPFRSPSTTLMSTNDLILPSDNKLDPAGSDRRPNSYAEDYENYTSLSSPIELRNNSIDDRTPRSMAYRPKTTLAPETAQFATSPSLYGASPRSFRSTTGTSSRRSSLAPDSLGNDIPLDAKWTRIRRSLINTEVLDQDGRRYEVRPDFVAVLGMLSREDVEDYVARSQAMSDAQRLRQPVQPPRPPPKHPEERRQHDSSEDEEEDYSPHEREDSQDHRPALREHQSYPPINTAYYPPSPNYVYGTSPSLSPMSPLPQPWPSPQYASVPMWIPAPPLPQPQPYYGPPVEEPRRRRSAPEKSSKDRRAERARWGEKLTAAGIGSAAASLLSVLSEAAADVL